MTLRPEYRAEGVEAVAAGSDGRRFLAWNDGFDAADLFGAPYTDEARLDRIWRSALQSRGRLCAEMGAAFAVLLVPDACGVHADALPEGLAYATPSIGDRFAAFAQALGIAVAWPREALRRGRGPVDVYDPDDGRCTAYGAAITYHALMAALPGDLARGRLDADALAFGWTAAPEGRAGVGPPPRRRLRPCSVIDGGRSRVIARRANERGETLEIMEVADPSLPSAVIFHDGAAPALAPLLAESFRRSVRIGTDERAYLEAVVDERPDLVILERSERSLLSAPTDGGEETWREAFPETGGQPGGGEAEIAARAALLSGNAASAAAKADRALALAPSVERCILAGRARLAAGDIDGAVAMLETAVRAAPDRWAALLHLGSARMAQGESAAARDLFARACAVAPWNPIGFTRFRQASLLAGDAQAGAAALQKAARLGAEHRGPRTGDPVRTAAALAEGVRLRRGASLLRAPAEPAGV